MPDPNYTYRGLIVEYWDLLRGDTSKWSSRLYFLKLIQDSGQPALDVACGTGPAKRDHLIRPDRGRQVAAILMPAIQFKSVSL